MLIIDKNDDYYDYLSNIYGRDPKVVYDRRKSIIIPSQQDLFNLTSPEKRSFKNNNNCHILLEAGFFQYVFIFKNIKLVKEAGQYSPDYSWQDAMYTYDFELAHVYNDNKHYFPGIMTLAKTDIYLPYMWRIRREKEKGIDFKSLSFIDMRTDKDKTINNPILKNTLITKFIEPQDIWMQLNNYISSLGNDKDVDIKNSDVDKAINHGFDKRWSFRHPIK